MGRSQLRLQEAMIAFEKMLEFDADLVTHGKAQASNASRQPAASKRLRGWASAVWLAPAKCAQSNRE